MEVPLDDTIDHITSSLETLCSILMATFTNKLTDDQVKSSPMSRNVSHREFELPKICKL